MMLSITQILCGQINPSLNFDYATHNVNNIPIYATKVEHQLIVNELNTGNRYTSVARNRSMLAKNRQELLMTVTN